MKLKLVRIGQVAKLLGISPDTLRRWDKKGKLTSIRIDTTGHRYYPLDRIKAMLNTNQNKLDLAKNWAQADDSFQLDSEFYCNTRDVFQARLETFQSTLTKYLDASTQVSLITAIIGEIGNNSFDHNLGNWPDMIGIFFYYDQQNQIIILADRGQGILKTLQRVKPSLKDSKQALKIAFTQIISARHPEVRGNGLKFVKSIVISQPLSLYFQTGDSFLFLKEHDKNIVVKPAVTTIRGCLAVFNIKRML